MQPETGSRFPGLIAVQMVLRIFAVLNLVGAVVGGVALMVHVDSNTLKHNLAGVGVLVLVTGIIWAVFQFGAAAAIDLGLAIEHNTRQLDTGPMKTCPQCAEPVRAAARVCRYCHANVANVSAPALTDPEPTPVVKEPEEFDSREQELADFRHERGSKHFKA